MKSRLWPIFLLISVLVLRAEDWATVDGKTYKNVQVVSHDDGYVTILDDDGGAKVMLTELPSALRARFGFDPAKASAFVAATEAADDKAKAALAAEKQKQDAAAAATPFGTTSPTVAVPAPVVAVPPAPPVHLPPGTLLSNGDFSQGDTGWEGDGNPARGGPGLNVNLSSNSWTRVYQSFQGDKGTQYSLHLTYRIVPGTTLSKDAGDYGNVLKKIEIPGFDHFGSFVPSPGQFFGTLGDPSSSRIVMEVYNPKVDSAEVQTYDHTYPPIDPNGNNTLVLAFPPGNGTVTLLSVAVTSK